MTYKPVVMLSSAALIGIALCSAAGAADKPDTATVLTQNKGFASIVKVEDLSSGSIKYEIDLCTYEDGCDKLKAKATELDELVDYAYLYVVYGRHYLSDSDAAATMAKDDADNGASQAIADHYSKRFGCTKADGDGKRCVMLGLKKAAGITFYSHRFDEGRDSYTPED